MGGYSFWETVRGTELAETLIDTLPELAKRQKNQEVLIEEVCLLRKSVDELKEELRQQK